MFRILSLIIGLSLANGCADESAFTAGGKSRKSGRDKSSSDASIQLSLDADTAAPVDYLFIIDNSNSMDAIIAEIKQGFIDIVEKGEFPPNSKLGVMSTAVKEGQNEKSKLNGFKSLVTRASIKRNPDRKDHGQGCVEGWFSPREKDGTAANKYCIEVASSFKTYGTNVEPGLTSFDRFLEEKKNDSPFRKNAALNVIFISDTHDVCSKNRKLRELRDSYSYEKFLKKVKKISNVASLTFHGIVPQPNMKKCSAEMTWDYSYSKYIETSGGFQAHCVGTDYAEFMSQMVEKSKSRDRILKLPDNLKGVRINSLKINNASKEFVYDEEKNQVMIRDVEPNFEVDQVVDIDFAED